MTYQFDGYNYLVRLEKGEKLIERLVGLVQEKNIQGGWISGLGGAAWVELGFYQLDNKHEYEWKRLDQALEITSLQGNVAWTGEVPMLHLHGSFSDDDMRAYGGHVRELEVAGTCELFIRLWNGDILTRTHNDAIGLKLLDL